MKLAVFNGSPRGQGSNTKLLLDQFLQAIKDQNGKCGWECELAYLVEEKEALFVEMFQEADFVILAFPLYTDSMPALVKSFIEDLEPFCGQKHNPNLGFIIQSGFPETLHSRYVEKYCQKLARRLGCPYLGTVIKGGVEGIQVKPPWMRKKLFASFYQLGNHFARYGEFDQDLIRRLAGREGFRPITRWIFRIMSKLGIFNFYWNDQLKKNHAFEQRFARPYDM